MNANCVGRDYKQEVFMFIRCATMAKVARYNPNTYGIVITLFIIALHSMSNEFKRI